VYVAYVVIAILLALMLSGSALLKLTRNQRIVDGLAAAGVPVSMFPFLALCEIAGAVGVLVGIWYAPLGIAAAIGLVIYFILAVGAHVRKTDYKGIPNAAAILVFSALALIARILSL
jgi:hypothetical protein